jgi:hypothetical protein
MIPLNHKLHATAPLDRHDLVSSVLTLRLHHQCKEGNLGCLKYAKRSVDCYHQIATRMADNRLEASHGAAASIKKNLFCLAGCRA